MKLLQRWWRLLWLRRLVWSTTAMLSLSALLYIWADWIGARKLKSVEAMLKANGETLDFRALMHDPVPEADNFCAIPLLKDLALVLDGDQNKGESGRKRNRLEKVTLRSPGSGMASSRLTQASLGMSADLNGWAMWVRAQGLMPISEQSGDDAHEVLAALAKHDGVINELASGIQRPHAQWTPEWKTRDSKDLRFDIELAHHAATNGLQPVLALRASAAVAAGDAAKSHETAQIMARLIQSSFNDPMLMGALIGFGGLTRLHGATWEMCRAHLGTAEDFSKLESTFATFDIKQTSLHAWRTEMAAAMIALKDLEIRRKKGLGQGHPFYFSGTVYDQFGAGIIKRLPDGFFDANVAELLDREFRYIIKPLAEQSWQKVLASAREWEGIEIEIRGTVWAYPTRILSCFTAPAFANLTMLSIRAQELVNEGVIACALERYRILHGNYPASLDAVKLSDGRPLPLDVISGKPMKYRKTSDGRYALWSVGYDGEDDDGMRVLNAKNPEHTKIYDVNYTGDWVWDFPEETVIHK